MSDVRKPRVVPRGVFISKLLQIRFVLAFPMALDPDIAPIPQDPMTGNPCRGGIRRLHIFALDPNIGAVTPTIVAFAPNHASSRRSGPNDDTRRWGRGRAS